MINNNGIIDQSDVQVVSETSGVTNVMPFGVIQDTRADTYNYLAALTGSPKQNGVYVSNLTETRSSTYNGAASKIVSMKAQVNASKTVQMMGLAEGYSASSTALNGVVGQYYVPSVQARWINNQPNNTDDGTGNPQAVNLAVRVYAENGPQGSNQRELITELVGYPSLVLGELYPTRSLSFTVVDQKPFPSGFTKVTLEVGFDQDVRYAANQLNSRYDQFEIWQLDITRAGAGSTGSVNNNQYFTFFDAGQTYPVNVDNTSGLGFAGARFKVPVRSANGTTLVSVSKSLLENTFYDGVFAVQVTGISTLRVGYTLEGQGTSIVWTGTAQGGDGYRKFLMPNVIAYPRKKIVAIHMEFSKSTAGDVYFDRVGFYPDRNAGSLSDADYFKWTGQGTITTSIYDIDISRGELELGIASISLKDAALDPATANGLKAGSRVWIKINQKATDAAADQWTNVFVGRISQVTTSYNAKRKIDIQMTVVDSMSKLATYPFRWAFDTIAELAEPLQWTSVNTIINGTAYNSVGVAPGNDNVISPSLIEDNMKAIDSVIVGRNTQQGVAYVNKNDVLVMDTNPLQPGSAIAVGDIKPPNAIAWIPYSIKGIDLGFDTSRVVNQVKVTSKTTNGDNTYMLTNKESYEQRGPAPVSIEVVDRTEAQCIAIATALLNKYEVPTNTATYVAFPVKTRAHLQALANVDVLQKVRVYYSGKLDADLVIRQLKIRIQPGKMTVRYGFTPKSDSAIWL